MSSDFRKIALLIPYYGAWPKFFSLYLSSLARQNLIHVHFFSDIPVDEYDIPKNCSVHNLSLSNVSKMLSDLIDKETKIQSGYKFCDIRPCYGELFAEYLKGYSHWAYGDIDLIYGLIERHLPSDWSQYDIISFREEWLSGALCIFKNSTLVNGLYKESQRYIEYFTCDEHVSFGEVCKKYKYVRNKPSSSILDFADDASHTYVIKRAEIEGRIKVKRIPKLKESIKNNEYLALNGSSILNNKDCDYILYHFVTEKNLASFTFPDWKHIPECYYIDITGFYVEKEFSKINRLRRQIVGRYLNYCNFLERKRNRIRARFFG